MAQAFSIQQIENSNDQVDRCGCTTCIEVSGINSGSSSLVLKFLSIPPSKGGREDLRNEATGRSGWRSSQVHCVVFLRKKSLQGPSQRGPLCILSNRHLTGLKMTEI